MATDDEDRLVGRLSELGRRRVDGVDLSADVRRRLDDRPQRSRKGRRGMFPALAGATAVVVIAGSAAAVPAVRDAVANLFDAGGIEVVKRNPTGATGSPSQPTAFARHVVGAQTPLAAAEASFNGGVLVPTALGPPTQVFQKGRLVTLVWRSPEGSDRPEWVVMEVVGAKRVLLRKIVESTAHVRRVDVSGQPAVWVSGPQGLFYMPIHGSGREIEALIGGRTLIWEQGDVAVRVESSNGLADTLGVAESFR